VLFLNALDAWSFASMLDRSLIRYLLVGVANTLVGLGVIYFSMYELGLGNVTSNALGYGVGIVVSFGLNRQWTFRHTGSALPAMARFLVVTAVAYVANLGAVLVLSEGLGLNRYLAQLGGAPPYTLVGYLGSRYFAFRAGRPGLAT
jgi:putative flippase GtrA